MASTPAAPTHRRSLLTVGSGSVCMRPFKCVKVPCSSTPHRSLARNQLRLSRHLPLPSIQLRQRPGAEATFRDLPLVVLLGEHRPHKPDRRSLGREDAYHVRPPCILVVVVKCDRCGRDRPIPPRCHGFAKTAQEHGSSRPSLKVEPERLPGPRL